MAHPAEVMYRNDKTLAAATAAAQKEATKAALAENLTYSTFVRLEFSKAAYPTITSMAQLEGENGAGLSALTTQRRRELLEDKSGLTEVEKTDGAWPAVERAGGGRLAVADLAKIWESQIAPAEKEPATRKGYFAAWRTVVTFALSHDDVGMVLPMTQDT